MSIEEADIILSNTLRGQYSLREVEQIKRIFWEDLFTSRGGINRVLHTQETKKFNEALEKLKSKMPIQYVTGISYFYELKLEVNEHVLIPRPETEELVYHFISENKNVARAKLIDIGTGSGCIPIIIKKKCRQFDVSAIDVSEDALVLARSNAERNEVRIKFSLLDFLNEDNWNEIENFDFVISNPPYIPQKERALMSESTLLFEPEIALFASDEEGIIFYQKLAKFGKAKLNQGGKLYLECNEFNARKIKRLFEKEGYRNARIVKDMQEKDRILVAEKP